MQKQPLAVVNFFTPSRQDVTVTITRQNRPVCHQDLEEIAQELEGGVCTREITRPGFPRNLNQRRDEIIV